MVPQLIEYHITQAVSAKAKAEAYSAEAVELRRHAEGPHQGGYRYVPAGLPGAGGEHFDTGVEAIAAACALPGLEAEGIFTHFAVSDEDGMRTVTPIHGGSSTCSARCSEQWSSGWDGPSAIRHCANTGAVAR